MLKKPQIQQMTLAKIISCVLLIIIGVSIHGTMASNSTVSQLHSQKKLHERQNMKFIKTKHGNLYDCVDFYEQPAFKHPQLKNHTFHPKMRPTFIPNITTTTTRDNFEISQYVLKNGGCPSGKVPIRRLSKEDHSRAATFVKPNAYGPTDAHISPPGTHFAILQTKANQSPPDYYGVGAYMSIWNPQVKPNQYSAAQISIQNGPESLQVGWMVNPEIYKDNRTHMFIHTNAGGLHCYNTYCPGFVIVQSDFPPDIPFDDYSKPGEIPWVINFFIYRETTTGNWWLLVTSKLVPIGFWPERIFTTLKKYGTYISCGGETYSPPDQPGGYPPMGSGEFPLKLWEQDAYASHFVTVNEKFKTVDVEDTEKFMDTKKYIVEDLGILKTGHVLYFGGYGG